MILKIIGIILMMPTVFTFIVITLRGDTEIGIREKLVMLTFIAGLLMLRFG